MVTEECTSHCSSSIEDVGTVAFVFNSTMKAKSKILLLFILFVSGIACRNRITRNTTNSHDIPLSREEALEFMQKLDTSLIITTKDTNVIRTIRSRMKGRLLSAGIYQTEIEKWIESPINQYQTERRL